MTTKKYAGLPYEDLVTKAMENQLLTRVQAGWKVLDLGISVGHAISPLAFAGLSILGVDKNLGALKFCRQEFDLAGIGELLTTANVDAFQFMATNTAKFNVVSMSDFLMFFTKTNAKRLIKSGYEALELGGLIWIVTKSANDDLYADVGRMRPIEPETYLIPVGCHGVSPVCFFRQGEIDDYLGSLGATVLYSSESENTVGGMVHTVLAMKEKK